MSPSALAVLLFLALPAAPAARAAPLAPAPGRAPLAQEEAWPDEPEPEPEDDDADGEGGRLRLTAWGGQAWDSDGEGRTLGLLGGEASWSFDGLDLGVAGYGYGDVDGDGGGSDPVVLARITQRFQTYRGLDAGLTFGLGAARTGDWQAWFQVALGFRLDLGPMYLAGELAFEQEDLLHLSAGLGVRLF